MNSKTRMTTFIKTKFNKSDDIDQTIKMQLTAKGIIPESLKSIGQF